MPNWSPLYQATAPVEGNTEQSWIPTFPMMLPTSCKDNKWTQMGMNAPDPPVIQAGRTH